VIDVVRASFLPYLSPIKPKINAPSGRDKNPTAKTAKVIVSESAEFSDGKKVFAIMCEKCA
jgi:hypothetical protein